MVQWLVPAMCGGAATLVAVAWRYGRAVVHGLRVLLRAEIIRIHREYVQTGRPVPLPPSALYALYASSASSITSTGTGTKMHDEIMAAHNGPTGTTEGNII